MSALPRPVTGPPWTLEYDDGSMHGIAPRWEVRIGDEFAQFDEAQEQDARAIAALPEWIAERDRFRAALAEFDRLLGLWAGSRPDDETEHLRGLIRRAIEGTEP